MSTDHEYSRIFNLCGQLTTPREFNFNYFVIVAVENIHFIGLITDINEDEGEAELSLLRPKVPSVMYRWPDDLMSYIAPLPDIKCAVDLEEQPENKYKLLTIDDKIKVATILKSG